MPNLLDIGIGGDGLPPFSFPVGDRKIMKHFMVKK